MNPASVGAAKLLLIAMRIAIRFVLWHNYHLRQTGVPPAVYDLLMLQDQLLNNIITVLEYITLLLDGNTEVLAQFEGEDEPPPYSPSAPPPPYDVESVD